jgi:MFS family permease
MSGVYTGAALGGIGGYIAESFGWRIGFCLFGIIGISYAIVLALSLRDTASRAAETKPTNDVKPMAAMVALFSVAGFWILLALNALVGVANWGINGWLPTYLKDQFHLGLGSAGLSATAYIQIASFIGVLVGGAWADRWARRNRRGRMVVPAIGYIIAGPCLFLSATAGTLAPALAGLIVFGLSRGFFDANHMPILRQLTNEKYSATGYGVLNFVSCSAGGVMIWVGGMLKDAHVPLSVVFEFSAGGLLVVGFLLLCLRPAKTSPMPARISVTDLNTKI